MHNPSMELSLNKGISYRILTGTAVCAAFAILSVSVFVGDAFADDISVTAEVTGDVKAVVQWAVPELRVGETIFVPGAEPGTNDDTNFYLTIRSSDNNDDVILFTMPALETTDVDGTHSSNITLTGITAGTYDIGFKGAAHLTKVLDDVALINGTNTLNITQPDNSAPKGTQVLLGGDINGAGTTPATLGDDVVNSVDISFMSSVFNNADPTGNGIRANINQDNIVNSVDLSILLKNLDVEGDN